MTNSLLGLLVFILLIAVTLNFFLTLRIASIVRETPEPQDLPFTLDLDTPAPPFFGKKLMSGTVVSSEAVASDTSMVLVFLSSGCGDCRKKLPELVQILPAVRHAGIELLIVGMEDEKGVRNFLGATPLFEHVVVVDKKTKKILNPRNGSPFYIFIDHQKIVKASNFVGDGNWQTFMEQMHELSLEMAAKVEHEV